MKKIYFLITAVLFVNIQYAQTSASLDSALIACFPFSGNANDDSGHNNSGTVNGAVLVADRFGNPNSAYSFNGSNQNILIPSFNTKINASEFSMSFWSTAPGYATKSAFLLSPDNSANRLNVHIYYGNTLSNSQTFFDWGNISNGRMGISGSPLPSGTSWDHWVFTTSLNNSNMKCYKNGVLVSTKTGAGTFNPATTGRDLLIGGGLGTSSTDLWFNGSLDDVKLYNKVLTQVEVNALYNQTTITCGVSAGIKTNNSDLNYEVYPNPVNSSLKIKGTANEKTDLIISSISGTIIKTSTFQGDETEINLDGLANGIYILTIKNIKGVQYEKIIKQ